MRWMYDAVVGLLITMAFSQETLSNTTEEISAASVISLPTTVSISEMSSTTSSTTNSTRNSLTFWLSTLPYNRTSTVENNNPSLLYGMAVYYERYELPLLKPTDELVVIGDNMKNISEVWFHTAPACTSTRDNYSLMLEIQDSAPNYIVAVKSKKDQYREEWKYPVFMCTRPKSESSEFGAIVVEDTRDLLLPLLFVVYCIFLALSALFTGLNLSIMSLDMEDLRRISEYDENPKNRRYAANIIPIRESGNFMLCTIILGNTICNTINVLTFDRMTLNVEMEEWKRILFINIVPSMFTIIFSEIIPQVICTKFALPIGSCCRRLMVFFMVLTYAASYPLSLLLDWVVGKEVRATMDRHMLGGLMRQQKYSTANIANVVENAMMLEVRRVRDVMTPLEKVFMISDRTEINANLKQQLNANRHTRIPVYKGDDRNCVIGVLNVKDLLLIDDSLDLHVGAVMQLWNRSTLFRFVSSEAPVVQLMLELKRGFPLAIVVDYQCDKQCYHVTGIVTLEDNLEEVIGEIRDEKDVLDKSRMELHMDVSVSSKAQNELPSKKAKKPELPPKKSKRRHITLKQEEIMPDEKTALLLPAKTPLKSVQKKKRTPSSISKKVVSNEEVSR